MARTEQSPRNTFSERSHVDGKNRALSDCVNVLVTAETIERMSSAPVTVDARAKVGVIAGNGRVLMPGLIDAALARVHGGYTQMPLMTSDPNSYNCWRERLRRRRCGVLQQCRHFDI